MSTRRKPARSCQAALTPTQEKFLAALLDSGVLMTACRATGVPERTARRWVGADATFREAYRQARQRIVQDAVFALQKAALHAVLVLTRVMLQESPERTSAIRIAAAKVVLEQALKVTDAEAQVAEFQQVVQGLTAKVQALEEARR